MSVTRPSNSRILTSVLLEFEKTVQPEIQSEQARVKGMMIAYLLQTLIIREVGGEEILRRTLARDLGLLRTAAELLEDAGLARLVDDLTVQPDAPVHTHGTLSTQHQRASAALERAVQKVIGRADHPPPEPCRVFLSEMLASEVAFLDAIDPKRLAPNERHSAGLSTTSDIDVAALNRYLAETGRFPGKDVTVTEVVRLLGGFSKDTFIATLGGVERPTHQIVIRRDCPSGPIDASVVDEYPVIARLFRGGFPVAEPFWVEPDASHFGSPFMVSRRVVGSAILHSNGVTLLAGAEAGANAARLLARLLARLHTTDLRSLGYSAEDARLPARDHVQRLVDEFEAYWRLRKSGPEPIMAAAFEWLRKNVPAVVPGPSVVHGDASLRNLLLHDGDVTALLDWETVHIGDPSEDLAYARRDITLVMPWEEFLAEYYEAGGPEYRAENGRYFELWANVRNGAYSLAHGFETAPVPDIRFAFSSAYYHREFLRNIAAFLGQYG